MLFTKIIDAFTKPDNLWENKGRHIAWAGIIIVHIAAAGLATATLPEVSCIVAIAGMWLYMTGARQTSATLNTDSDTLQA